MAKFIVQACINYVGHIAVEAVSPEEAEDQLEISILEALEERGIHLLDPQQVITDIYSVQNP